MLKKMKEKWFRCPKCGKSYGPYGKNKEVAFCAHCGSIMKQVSKESARKKALYD